MFVFSLWWVLYLGGGLLLLVTIPLLLASLYLVHVRKMYSHIPSPKMNSFFLGHAQNYLDLKKEINNADEPFDTIALRWVAEVGNTYVIFLISRPLVMSSNPEDVKRVAYDENVSKSVSQQDCVVSVCGQRFMGSSLVAIPDYETWKPRRKLFDPTFKRNSLKEFIPKFNECVDEFLERLRAHAEGKTEVFMKKAFHDVTADVISKVAFSSDFNKQWDSKKLGLKYISDGKLSNLTILSFKGAGLKLTLPMPSLFFLLHPHQTAMYREAIGAMRRIGQDCIEKRIKAVIAGEEVPDDILTLILQGSVKDNSVNMEVLVDDFVTFYVAGQETTANVLSFAIILIHQYPEVLDQLLTEIDSVLGDKKKVTDDDLNKLKYTEQVIQETMRVYPIIGNFTRDSPKNGIMISGYHITEGTTIAFFTSVMCRNPEYFTDPDRFDPSRFDADKPRPGPYVYFPFSVGHRSCIGRHFAVMEAKMILARLLQTFKVTLSDPSYKLVVKQHTLNQPKGDVPCYLEEIIH